MHKRVGILTLQYSNNYGGFLQAYALSCTLIKLGYTPVIINRHPKSPFEGKIGKIKYLYQKHLWKSFEDFRKVFFPETTSIIRTQNEISTYSDSFYAVIVGSDQVWRLQYTMDEGLGLNMFLDFVSDKTKKISYAASFGKENFEGNAEIIKQVKFLLKRFTAVSVREDSGKTICKDAFNIDAIHVLDPTMLLDAEEYEKIIEKEEFEKNRKFVSRYFLDSTTEKLNIADSIANKFNVPLDNIYRPAGLPFSLRDNLVPSKKYIYPSFANWLYKIKNAEFIVADSFHGVVFSIIFNKQFVCIANKSRGLARMESLLGQFNLIDRLVFETDSPDKYLNLPEIEYSEVNKRIKELKDFSISFLEDSLKS